MEKFYNEYFHIPKNGKISEKVMFMRVVITAILMIICLAAMSLTAYAYFSHNVSSGSNIIKAAEFDVTVAVTVTKDETSEKVEARDDGSYLLTSGTYSVSLTKAGTATTGFCIVDITVGQNTGKYHTQQLGVDGEDQRLVLEFTLDLSELSDTATVKFIPHWGTSHFYGYDNTDENELYIKEKSSVKITDAGSANMLGDSNEDETTESTEVVYIIKLGDTLGDIAKEYGVSIAQITAYNSIENPNEIQAGWQIKIPPSDWEIPADITDT